MLPTHVEAAGRNLRTCRTFVRSFGDTGALLPARNSSPENEDQSLFSSHFLRIRAATTKAGAVINRHCLINFGRLSPASVLLLFFHRSFCSDLCRLCRGGASIVTRLLLIPTMGAPTTPLPTISPKGWKTLRSYPPSTTIRQTCVLLRAPSFSSLSLS